MEILIKLALGLFSLVFVINVTGKGNLAPNSATDQIQNYVLGGIIGGVIYNSSISILQYAVILMMWTILVLTLKWLNNNVRFVKRLIDGKPTLLIKNGQIDPEACRSVGLSAADVALKLRSQGIFQMKQVKRAVQEQNGQLIVVQMGDENPKYPVVTDGVIQVDVLESIGRSEEWLLDNLNKQGHDSNTSTKELYDCIVICKKNLMIGYFDNCVKIAYSNIDKEEINQINQICENHKKENEKLNNLFIVTYSHNYFSLKQSQVNEPAIQIDRHYNDDFVPVAAEIENFLLEDNKSGLIILHGKQGTGKTTYIRHLINLGKKRMIYMSGDLVDKLSDPSFITFIRQQKNSIFIVEDCEELLSSRNGGNRMNAGLVNILNISDGLLSDELCIKFICTFNAPLKDIDEALLRKGRLAARYEFKDLTTDKVNQLIKEESLDIPEQTHPMTLAEIYNYEGMDFSQGRKRVGF